MAITDYIPNVFGSSVPSTYESLQTMGLLTPQQVEQQQKTANIQGLLGAGLALAQGMSRTGPRRSAAENILGALAGGFGAAGGAYQQGLQNVVQRQQLQSAALQQQQAVNKAESIKAAKLKYPDLAYLADIDQGKFAEEVALRNRINFGGQQGPETPESLRAQAQNYLLGGQQFKPLADALFDKANRLELTTSSVSQPVAQPQQAQVTQEQPVQAIATQELKPGIVVTKSGETTFGIPNVAAGEKYKYPEAPVQVDSQTGEKVLPVVPVTGQRVKSKLPELNAKADSIRAEMDRLSDPRLANNPLVDKAFANQEKRLEQVRKQIAEAAVSEVDLETFRNTAPQQFQNSIDNLAQLQMTGQISPDQLSQRMNDISKQINDYRQKELDFERAQKDYTKEAYRVGQKIAPGVDPKDYTPEILAKIDAEMFGKDKELRRLSRSLMSVTVGDKVLAGERAKAQSKAEESAISAQNAASDVAAIVDILKPYRGGALQDFAGSIGAYLPGTNLEQLATAKQAAEAIRARLAPTLRVEGSGATSDFEAKSYLSAIPSLFNTAQGRELMAIYGQRLADRAVAAADIRARLVEENRYSIKNFQEELRKQGLDRVFTNDDLNILRGKASATPGSTLPESIKKKYGLEEQR